MDKLKNYKGSTELGSGLRPMGDNDFPLAEAHHIQTREDGTRLDEELVMMRETQFTTDNSLILSEDKVLSVNVTNEASGDNTLPISSSAVHTIVGNIEVLLNTI